MTLFHTGCVVCRTGHEPLCSGCARQLEPAPAARVRGVGPVPALFAYSGSGARVVQALKFRDGRRLVGPLADGLCGLVPGGVEPIISWIPTSNRRRRERGFDQSELLARAVARRLGVRCRQVLERVDGPAQTGRSRTERMDVQFVPCGRPTAGRTVLVDDVCTTGSTIRGARSALVACDTDPSFVVVARTP